MNRFLAVALDPIHPGAGGYRLGRVDNTITRDPATNLPKIPGTGLHGATKAYAAIVNNAISCAGNNTCHKRNCPICYTFGATEVDDGSPTRRSYKGVVRFTDTEIIFFPVSSMYGPVWITTNDLLKDIFGIEISFPSSVDQLVTTLSLGEKGLNLGWLLFRDIKVVNKGIFQKVNVAAFANSPIKKMILQWNNFSFLKKIEDYIVIVHPILFSQLVNSNLEVRTSVAIEPDTGAAKEGALFTYEAIPRGTIMSFTITCQELLPVNQRPINKDPLDIVKSGLQKLAILGLGGMGTRGFGRLEVFM